MMRRQRNCVFLFVAIATLLCGIDRSHAALINGGFDESGGSLDGWTTTGGISGEVDAALSFGGRAGFIQPHSGDAFAFFNFDGNSGGPLSQNLLSQTVIVDGTRLLFFWNRAQLEYSGTGEVTFQVSYQDLTAGTPANIFNVDFAPNGSTPEVVHPWRRETIMGLTSGNMYNFEFRGGFSDGMPAGNANGSLHYALDSVGVVPEPSSVGQVAVGAWLLVCIRRRRR